MRILRELEAAKTSQTTSGVRLLHLLAVIACLATYKIYELFTLEKAESSLCPSQSRFGEKKVEFTLLAVIVVFLVLYVKVVVLPYLKQIICSKKEKQTNGL